MISKLVAYLTVYGKYFWKSTKWMCGNAIFGIFPLLFMCSIYYISGRKVGAEIVDSLVYEGSVIFVCIAIVGAVLVEYYLSGFRLNGIFRISVYLFPAVILYITSINYYLIKKA